MAKLRYKIKIEKREEPGEEKINKHKDFNKLMYNYHHLTRPIYKTPLYKTKNAKVLLVLLIILLLTYILSEMT